MTNTDGQFQQDRQSIADVFATFYEQLYNDTQKHTDNGHQPWRDDKGNHIPAFTKQELHKALRQLKNGKAADSNGIVAEMLKTGESTLREVLLNLYNTILQPGTPSPSNWQHTLIKVLYKSGDPKLPQNYRPIATIPMLYKLFARLLYNRLEPTLDKQQSCDQAGFRRNRSTTNHLFTISLMQEISDEWQIPVWIAAVDFKKAFDSVTHAAIWEALHEQGVPSSYIGLLDKLYSSQTAAVKTDRRSRCFNIDRGTKQGDPLSSLLFNCVSENVMRKVKHKWNHKRWGLPLQPHRTTSNMLTNLRFADDVLLVATSLPQLSSMIADLSVEARKTGLQLHPDKTKIMHNDCRTTDGPPQRRTPSNIKVLNMTIDILPTHDSTKYLGRQLSFQDPHRTELENRISFAWRRFYGLKQELTGHRYALADRLRLFHGTVTPTILYRCEAWTLTTKLENRLKRTQRQMLRMILHAPRRRNATQDHQRHTNESAPQPSTGPHQPPTDATDSSSDENDVNSTTSTTQRDDQQMNVDEDTMDLEPWTDWIRRCTHDVEMRMKTLKLDDWVVLQRRRKWRCARKVMMTAETDWMLMTMRWDPTLDHLLNSRRRQGRPKTRWCDDIRRYIATQQSNMTNDADDNNNNDGDDDDDDDDVNDRQWQRLAQDDVRWADLEEGFCQR